MTRIQELRDLCLEKLGHPKSLGNIDASNLKYYLAEETFWSLLLELTSFFLLSYMSSGKIKIRVWQVSKHVQMILLIKDLLERLWKLIKKKNIS